MRLQLNITITGLILLLLSFKGFAQEEIKQADPTEINILFDYYEQDGNHSAVTGGLGTEQLRNREAILIITTPISKTGKLRASAGIDHYTSASSANLDKHTTSASSPGSPPISASDTRKHINIGYSKKNPKKNSDFGISLGYSKEYDVTSYNTNGKWSKASLDQNKIFAIKTNFFYDRWLLIYPGELRKETPKNNNNDDGNGKNAEDDEDDAENTRKITFEKDNRYTYNIGLSYEVVINQKMNAAILTDFTYQEGLLSTPFHRAYFDDRVVIEKFKTVRVEKLPRKRLKAAIGFRTNYFVHPKIITRFYYRFYIDNFGLNAHTLGLELPLKVTKSITLYPFYRFYIQKESKYFKAYGEHQIEDNFYTSDYDLSTFNSTKIGLGIKLAPPKGVFNIRWSKTRVFRFHNLEIRYSNYKRTDGLKADNIMLGSTFKF